MKNMVGQTKERTLSVHNEHEFLLKLEKAELTNELAQKVIDSKNNELAAKVVRLIQNGGFEPTTSQKLAREIMGKNFFGIEEVIRYYGVKPAPKQLSALAEIPFTEAELREVKDTHVLVAVFPLSILEIRDKVKSELFYSHKDAWYNEQAFAKDKGETRWQLVRKTPVDNSTSKDWNEQQALLGKNEETLKAQAMVYTIIGHFLATSECLFKNIYVRCSDVDSDGYRVDVGNFDSNGLDVGYYSDVDRYDYIGVASARKFNN
jgi:hypothetical protein